MAYVWQQHFVKMKRGILGVIGSNPTHSIYRQAIDSHLNIPQTNQEPLVRGEYPKNSERQRVIFENGLEQITLGVCFAKNWSRPYSCGL